MREQGVGPEHNGESHGICPRHRDEVLAKARREAQLGLDVDAAVCAQFEQLLDGIIKEALESCVPMARVTEALQLRTLKLQNQRLRELNGMQEAAR